MKEWVVLHGHKKGSLLYILSSFHGPKIRRVGDTLPSNSHGVAPCASYPRLW
jgi:hypothetical protein